MSKEAVRLFAEKIEQDEDLQDIVREWYDNPNSGINLAEIGLEHGFEFTEEEGYEVWEEIQNGEELSDFTLELISGGLPINCSNGSREMPDNSSGATVDGSATGGSVVGGSMAPSTNIK